MKDKSKPKYSTGRNLETGKVTKRKIDYDDFPIMDLDVSAEDNEPFEVIRTLQCPFQLDNSEVYKEITKPIKQANFTCNVDVEILLHAVSEEGDNHKHRLILDVDKELHKPGVDPSEYEIDYGGLFCGIFYNVVPTVQVTLIKKDLTENAEVEKKIAQIENKALDENLVEMIGAEVKANHRRLNGHKKLFTQMTKYFEDHLTSELKRVAERLAMELHSLNDRGEEREISLNLILDDENREIRKRLPANKGRVPIKERNDYQKLRYKFLSDSVSILKDLEAKKAKLNKSQLAKKMFRGDNPLLLLNRKLKDFELTFEAILQKYSEQKSS